MIIIFDIVYKCVLLREDNLAKSRVTAAVNTKVSA